MRGSNMAEEARRINLAEIPAEDVFIATNDFLGVALIWSD